MVRRDLNIQSGRYARHISFRAEKIKNKERMAETLGYVVGKLKERFGDIIASDFTIQYFEYDAENFVNNRITATISFDYLFISE